MLLDRYSLQVCKRGSLRFFDDKKCETCTAPIGENDLITVVCEEFHEDDELGKWILEKARKNLVICYVLTQSHCVEIDSNNIIFVFLHSLSDISISEATKKIFETGEANT